ncbi:MAG: pepsin/retropepsin-like aspartic protease family protein [Phenylobacterium sp.]|nr:pepsin/retropepsin-like aspartic protease family protein [Phenylobacterium sp.]
MSSRRAFLTRALLVAAAGGGLFLIRDRLPWPTQEVRFANGRSTPWLPVRTGVGLIEVDAVVAGRTLPAIIDSGAQFTAIDRTVAEALDLPRSLSAPMMAYGVSGGPTLTHTVRFDLELPGLTAPDLRGAVLDLAGVARLAGRDFRLLIGRDLLRHVVLEADLANRRTRLVAPEAFRAPYDAHSLPIAWRSGAPVARVEVGDGGAVEALIDTGSSNVLAVSENAAKRLGILGADAEVRTGRSVSLGGLSLNRVVTVSRIQVGALPLRGVDVFVYRPNPAAPAPEAILGSGLFRRHGMALDLPGGRLYLSPPGVALAPPPITRP